MCLKMRKCAKSGESIRKYANLEQDCLLLFLKYNYFFGWHYKSQLPFMVVKVSPRKACCCQKQSSFWSKIETWMPSKPSTAFQRGSHTAVMQSRPQTALYPGTEVASSRNLFVFLTKQSPLPKNKASDRTVTIWSEMKFE